MLVLHQMMVHVFYFTIIVMIKKPPLHGHHNRIHCMLNQSNMMKKFYQRIANIYALGKINIKMPSNWIQLKIVNQTVFIFKYRFMLRVYVMHIFCLPMETVWIQKMVMKYVSIRFAHIIFDLILILEKKKIISFSSWRLG